MECRRWQVLSNLICLVRLTCTCMFITLSVRLVYNTSVLTQTVALSVCDDWASIMSFTLFMSPSARSWCDVLVRIHYERQRPASVIANPIFRPGHRLSCFDTWLVCDSFRGPWTHKAIIDIRRRPQSDTAPLVVALTVPPPFASPMPSRYLQAWRHQQNRKYILQSATPLEKNRATCTKNLVKFGLVVFEIMCGIQWCVQTDTPIAIHVWEWSRSFLRFLQWSADILCSRYEQRRTVLRVSQSFSVAFSKLLETWFV